MLCGRDFHNSCNGILMRWHLLRHEPICCFFLSQNSLNPINDTVGFFLSVLKPVCRPDTVDFPAEVLQNLLPETVTVACRQARMISGPITFNSQDVGIRFVRVLYSNVDEIAGDPHLRLNFETSLFESL